MWAHRLRWDVLLPLELVYAALSQYVTVATGYVQADSVPVLEAIGAPRMG